MEGGVPVHLGWKVMAKKQISNSKLAHFTDREIYALIRYLDPNPESEKEPTNQVDEIEQDCDSAIYRTCVSLLIVLLGCIGFLWLYYRL